MKAFLVDDEPLAVSRLKRLLEETGRAVIAGASGDPRQALEELRKARPDVVFLDIEMPGMSGFELLEQADHRRIVHSWEGYVSKKAIAYWVMSGLSLSN